MSKYASMAPNSDVVSPFRLLAPLTTLKNRGISGADEFRKIFLGKNPLYRLGILTRYRTRREIITLIRRKVGAHTYTEAMSILQKALGNNICYRIETPITEMVKETEVVKKMKPEKKKRYYFTLCKEVGEDRYYLDFTTSEG